MANPVRRALLGVGLMTSVAISTISAGASAQATRHHHTSLSVHWKNHAHLETAPYVFACPTSRSCIGLDGEGDTLHFDGSTWSAERSFPNGIYPTALTCPTQGFCGAVINGEIRTYRAGLWSDPVKPVDDDYPRLTCTSPTFCAAFSRGGFDLATQQHIPPTESTFDGSAWSDPQTVAPKGYIFGASCATPTECIAVGVARDRHEVSFQFADNAWTGPTLLSERAPAMRDIACANATFCVATNADGRLFTYDGTAWRDPFPGAGWSTFSCASSRMCMAFNDFGRYRTFDGSHWSKPRIAPWGQRRSKDVVGHEIFTRLSCPSVHRCIAIHLHRRSAESFVAKITRS
jgi:hypothetical protein